MNLFHCAAINNHVCILQFAQDTMDSYDINDVEQVHKNLPPPPPAIGECFLNLFLVQYYLVPATIFSVGRSMLICIIAMMLSAFELLVIENINPLKYNQLIWSNQARDVIYVHAAQFTYFTQFEVPLPSFCFMHLCQFDDLTLGDNLAVIIGEIRKESEVHSIFIAVKRDCWYFSLH